MDNKEPIEVNQEALKALEEKRKAGITKDKKRRRKAFLVAELLGLGIIVAGFALYLVFLGAAVLLVGFIMAGVFCCISLPLIYFHRKDK